MLGAPFFFAWITTVSLKMTTFFRCQVMPLDAYISKLLFKGKLVQERYLDLFLSFLNLFEVKAYFKLYPYFILFIHSFYLFIFFFGGERLQKQTKIPYHYRGLIMTICSCQKSWMSWGLMGNGCGPVSEIGALKHFLLNNLSCTQSNKF